MEDRLQVSGTLELYKCVYGLDKQPRYANTLWGQVYQGQLAKDAQEWKLSSKQPRSLKFMLLLVSRYRKTAIMYGYQTC